MALYALARDGWVRDDPVVGRAIQLLADTQADDGSWPVKGTKQKDRNEVTETATDWGACWAVIGMLEFGPLK